MIFVYDAGATDFTNNGLGALKPENCLVTEEINGEYSLTLVHPIDETGKWRRLRMGNIIKAPVPAGKTPRINTGGMAQTETEIWMVNTGEGNTLYLRSQPTSSSKALGSYRRGTEVVRLAAADDKWSEVTTPDGKRGYMFTEYLKYVRTETSGEAAEETIREPMTVRDQPFRIYKTVPTLKDITVYARHIYYDLMDNHITEYKPGKTASGAAAFKGMERAAEDEHGFTFYSDLESTAEDFEIIDKNPAEAIQGDGGIIDNYGGELMRDWWDVYLAKRIGEDRQTEIREGKNMLGVSYSEDTTDTATRIIPYGEDKDGKRLYLPERYIDSERIGAYPNIKWMALEVKDAKERTSGKDKRTKEECWQMMREAAQKAFEGGADLPVATLKVDFIDLSETEEYKGYAMLQGIHMGDTVKVITSRLGITVSMRMTKYTYDCLSRKYQNMTLGTVEIALDGNSVSGKNIESGTIRGSLIAPGSIGGGQIAANAIKAGNIDVFDLFADTATIGALDAYIIRAETIRAIENELDVWAEDKISIGVGRLNIGGENLIRNGGFYNGLDGWAQYSYGINGTGHQMYVATENRDVPNLWLHAENETGVFGAIQTVKGLRKNEQYIIHGYAAVRNTGGFSVEIRDAASGTFRLSKRFPITAWGEDNLSLYEKFEAVFETGESTDVNILLYCNTFGANGYIFLAQIKLEEGNTATAWSPARTDPANSLTAGSSVIINEDEVRITTKRFEVEGYKEDGSTATMRFTADALAVDRIESPSVAPRYMGPAHIYADPAATSAQIAAGTHFRTLSDALQTVNNRQLGYEVTIHMAGGMTEYGELMVVGLCGEALFITSDSANHATLHGAMRIRRCSAEVEITYLDAIVPSNLSLSPYIVRSCSYVRIAECVISCRQTAFHISRGANVMAENNTLFVEASQAGYVMYGGRAHFQNNIGSGALVCDAGVMTIAGTVPEMGVTYLNTFEPNNIDAVTPTGAGGAPAAPVVVTAEYPMMHADSYAAGNVDSWAYPQSKPSDDLYQGYTGQAGRICGCIWFDNAAIREALNTKTVNQASIRLTAQKYVGRGAAVTVCLRGTATEYAGRSGHPALTTDYGAIGTAEPGMTVTLTIPNQAVNDLVNGTINGLVLYSEDVRDMEGRNYSQNYMRFDGGTSGTAETRPALTVVYQ